MEAIFLSDGNPNPPLYFTAVEDLRLFYQPDKLGPVAIGIIPAGLREPFENSLIGRAALRGQAGPQDPLFASRKRKAGPSNGSNSATLSPITRTQAYRMLREAFECCELDIEVPGTHVMRKTFAQEVYEGFGGDLFKTSKALGHASPASTVAYLSFQEEELDQVVSSAWSYAEEKYEHAPR